MPPRYANTRRSLLSGQRLYASAKPEGASDVTPTGCALSREICFSYPAYLLYKQGL